MIYAMEGMQIAATYLVYAGLIGIGIGALVVVTPWVRALSRWIKSW